MPLQAVQKSHRGLGGCNVLISLLWTEADREGIGRAEADEEKFSEPEPATSWTGR